MDHKTPSKTINSQELSKTRYTIKKKKVIRKKINIYHHLIIYFTKVRIHNIKDAFPDKINNS